MATESSTSVSKTAIPKLPEFIGLDSPVQLSLEQLKSLAPLDLETSKYGKITVDVAVIKANTAKIQKAQKLYLEALEFYECGMVNLAFEACKDAINLKSEDQLTNSLLEKLLEKIQNKRDEEKYIVLTEKEKEFSDKIIECEKEIRELKKERESLNNEQKFKIYSQIYNAFFSWGQLLLNNDSCILSIEKYKKALCADKICIEIDPDNIKFYEQQGHTLNNIGVNYRTLGVFAKALFFYTKSIDCHVKSVEMNKDKKASIFANIKASYGRTHKNIAQIHKIFGDRLLTQKEYKKAYSEYEKGQRMLRKAQKIYECNENLELMRGIHQSCGMAIANLLEKKG